MRSRCQGTANMQALRGAHPHFWGFRRTRRPCRTSERRWRGRGGRGIVLENSPPLLGFERDGRIASHSMIVATAVIANARCKTRSRTRMRVETTVNAGVFEAKLIDQMMFSD